MTVAVFLSYLGAILGGGFTLKVLDILYAELRRSSDQKRAVTEFIDTHLDPVLKTADDLAAKLRRLGGNDFLQIRDFKRDTDILKNTELWGLLYLFARFWSRVEIFKLEGLTLAIPMDQRGHRLNEFFNCLESGGVRLVSRTVQRAIAEMAIDSLDPPIHTTMFINFVPREDDEDGKAKAKRWLTPLREVVTGWGNTTGRQGLLQYYTLLQALIDTLDSEHVVTKPRPGIPNKLTDQTKGQLHDVFNRPLCFVSDRQKYLVPPKKEAPIVVVM